MNPSFRPPPPISDYQREIMWKLFSRDPKAFSLRRLARRFNLSRKRVDAILRLKGMEKDWIKVRSPNRIFVLLWCSWLVFKTHTWFHFFPSLIQMVVVCLCSHLTIVLSSPGSTLSPSPHLLLTYSMARWKFSRWENSNAFCFHDDMSTIIRKVEDILWCLTHSEFG